LIENLENSYGALAEVMKISRQKIYNHVSVLEIEIAGYNVMSELLGLFIPALLKRIPSHKDKKVLKLFPRQFTEFEHTDLAYDKVMNAFDFISGMTDLYATELYRKLKGVDIPLHY
jgi:dGTPase